ncbi:MAG: 16S rRNA (guanine(966)-N(2))-methyltransferase RsmD [Chromatiales bacterium]|nr:16S rRNA (guanine(966)-N(2))-methyltransferase RsmD [Chromatiales bacterium]
MTRRTSKGAERKTHSSGGRRNSRPGHSNQIRIIGGDHRGRKLSFPDLPGLRPTSDRTRETLFNWLQPVIQGARCLDLFAGSGALGFEAASRGASRVVMLDRAAAAVQLLKQNSELLQLGTIEVIQANALQWLEDQPPEPFDVVFLDPPFAERELYESCQKLQTGGWLATGAQIYVEADISDGLPQIPAEWQQMKEKKAGQVAFFLYTI